MKKIILAAAFLAIVSCKKNSDESFGKPLETTAESVAQTSSPEVLGKEIFDGKGNCFACHQVDAKVIGPSLKDIASIYKDKNGNMVSFFKGEGEAIVDPEQYELMKPNIEITKTFTDEELKALEAYVYSTLN